MGSTEEGSGGQDGWWESPSLSLVDLRQHSESWSLGGDAATASLLLSMSQKLVSRTHEVEEMLQNVLEESNHLSSAIMNTSNAFHMLANTQFIENRTYQDDADVAKSKVPELQTKSPPTEEETILRCKAAIASGIDLVSKCYERHEIQDSDSEDENESPVPVYALIDPYETKPLPYVIGSHLFMQENKIGLLEPSSEENSKTTLTPDDSESEEESFDPEKKNKPIPASSSKITDDESDSDISEGSFGDLGKNHIQNSHRSSTSLMSDDDDDEEEYFKPVSKGTQKITSNGPSLTSELNKKLGSNVSSADSSAKIRSSVFDSESDEDGDIFKKRDSSGDLFGKPSRPPSHVIQGEDRSDSSISRTGVENVRALPNSSKVQIPAGKQPLSSRGGDIFGSDSDDDDDGDLFSSKPRSMSVASKPAKKPMSQAPTPKSVASAPKVSASLFSSDGDEEEEGGGLFSSKSAASQIARADDGEKTKEESPRGKTPERKIPVGGVSVFGSAITSALQKHVSDSEKSDNDSDWEDKERAPIPTKAVQNDVTSNSSVKTQESQPSQNAFKQPTVFAKSSEGHGLFDDDEEEDDDLFGTSSKRSESGVSKTSVQNDKQPQSAPLGIPKDISGKNVPTTEAKNTPQLPKIEKKPVRGLFSDEDEDDDLFGFPARKETKASILPVHLANSETPDSKNNTQNEKHIEKVPSENIVKKPTATPAVKIPTESKPQNSSLFSSPSDDDLFSPPSVSQTTKPVPIVSSQPPPLPDAGITKPSSDLFGSPSSDSDFFTAPVSESSKSDKSIEKVTTVKSHDRSTEESVIEKPPPIPSGNIFSSPSDDDDDLFSFPSVNAKSVEKSGPPSGSVKVDKKNDESTNIKSGMPKKNNVESNDDDLFAPKKVPVKSDKENSITAGQVKVESKPKENLFASVEEEDDIFSGVVPKSSKTTDAPTSSVNHDNRSKKINLFDSPDSEDDIFASVPKDDVKNVASVPSSKETKLPKLENNHDKDIFSSSSSQKDSSSTKKNKTSIPPQLDGRESPPPLPPDLGNSKSSEVVKETSAKENSSVDKKPVIKKPVGGVAIFPIATKDNSSVDEKTVIKKPVESVVTLPTQKPVIADKPQNESANEKVADIQENVKDGKVNIAVTQEVPKDTSLKRDNIFGIDDDDDDGDDLFVGSSSTNLVNQTTPPPLPTEAEVTAKVSYFTKPKPPLLEGRESPPPLPPDLGSSKNSEQVKEIATNEDSSKNEKPVTKKPIGGVAIFPVQKPVIANKPQNASASEKMSPKENVRDYKEHIVATQEVIKETPQKVDDIFGIDDDEDLFGSSSSTNLVHQTTPPPLPIEVSPKSSDGPDVIKSKASSVMPVQDGLSPLSDNNSKEQGKTTDSTLKTASTDIKDSNSKEVKLGISVEEGRERAGSKAKEIPKKKPPVGGVSLFGGGGLGGSELFAKVKQRKSMLGSESEEEKEEEEDEKDSTASSSTDSKTEEKDRTTPKSPSSSFSESLSPRSPLSPISPKMPSSLSSKTTTLESGVSFEDKVQSNTLLHSVNKTRARGNKQRRPPSRAHRRGEVSSSAVPVTPSPVAPVKEPPSDTEAFQNTQKDSVIQSSSLISSQDSLTETTNHTKDGDVQKKIMESVPNKVKRSDSQSHVQTLKNKNTFEDDDFDDDLFKKPRSASNLSASSGSGKKSSHSHTSSSLFGDNSDNDDDNLFKSSKLNSSSNVKAKTKAAQSVKNTSKPSPSKGLFSDDDDDIFSSSGKDLKPLPTNTPKPASGSLSSSSSTAAKPKSTLKPSSEPFEDPLLGNLK